MTRLAQLTQATDRAVVRARPLASARGRDPEEGPGYAAASRELEAVLAAPRPTAEDGDVSFAVIDCVTAVLPACWLVARLWERWRLRPGLCPPCGYDLRATPAGAECGRVPADSARPV